MANDPHRVADPALILCEDRWFVVEQCRSCPFPGYLIVRSTEPASDLGALSVDAAARLGPLLRRITRAIHAVLQPIRVYVAQFGEQQNQFHFHVLPEQAELIHGPMLLDWARQRYRNELPLDETIRVFRELRDRLADK